MGPPCGGERGGLALKVECLLAPRVPIALTEELMTVLFDLIVGLGVEMVEGDGSNGLSWECGLGDVGGGPGC